MEIIIHRVNKIKKLKKIPSHFGVEIDIRSFKSKLILNHEPFMSGDSFDIFLREYHHGTLVLNIKEAGIEDEVLKMVRSNSQIKSYFLLDVEFPYIYRASRNGERHIAIRYSEDESIDTVIKYKELVDWVWIDTNTILPINNDNKNTLQLFNTCLVCPERWGRDDDIKLYIEKIKELDFRLNAVMTSMKNVRYWE